MFFLFYAHLNQCLFPESDDRQPLDREAGFLSDTEDELTDSHKTSKHSEIYSATVPSIDSAMSSWDSSGFDAGYSSQGDDTCCVKQVTHFCSDELSSDQISEIRFCF